MRMNIFSPVTAVNWRSSKLRLMDYGLALAVIAGGLLFQQEIVTWIGLAGLAMALLNPMGRIQSFLNGMRKPAR